MGETVTYSTSFSFLSSLRERADEPGCFTRKGETEKAYLRIFIRAGTIYPELRRSVKNSFPGVCKRASARRRRHSFGLERAAQGLIRVVIQPLTVIVESV